MGKAWWYLVGVAMGGSSSRRSSQTHLTINTTFWIVLQVVVATGMLQQLTKVRKFKSEQIFLTWTKKEIFNLSSTWTHIILFEPWFVCLNAYIAIT